MYGQADDQNRRQRTKSKKIIPKILQEVQKIDRDSCKLISRAPEETPNCLWYAPRAPYRVTKWAQMETKRRLKQDQNIEREKRPSFGQKRCSGCSHSNISKNPHYKRISRAPTQSTQGWLDDQRSERCMTKMMYQIGDDAVQTTK